MATKKRNPNGSGNISQREDGRYELKVFVDTPDGRRKRISVYASTWEDADAERTRLKDLQRKGIPVDSTTSTVEQYMRYWLTEIAQPSVRETTFSSYELLVRLYVVPGLGKRRAACVASTTHSRVAERIADNVSVLCTGEGR